MLCTSSHATKRKSRHTCLQTSFRVPDRAGPPQASPPRSHMTGARCRCAAPTVRPSWCAAVRFAHSATRPVMNLKTPFVTSQRGLKYRHIPAFFPQPLLTLPPASLLRHLPHIHRHVLQDRLPPAPHRQAGAAKVPLARLLGAHAPPQIIYGQHPHVLAVWYATIRFAAPARR